MIWFDLVTPKCVMFFEPLIRVAEAQGRDTIITTRGGPGYYETHALLELKGLPFSQYGSIRPPSSIARSSCVRSYSMRTKL